MDETDLADARPTPAPDPLPLPLPLPLPAAEPFVGDRLAPDAVAIAAGEDDLPPACGGGEAALVIYELTSLVEAIAPTPTLACAVGRDL